MLDEQIGHVTQRIRELRTLQKDLKALRARCSSPHAIERCGILNELDSAAEQSTSAERTEPLPQYQTDEV